MSLDWQVELTESAKKQLAKINKIAAKRITSYLRTRVAQDPRRHGKPLKGLFNTYWCYRVGDYRIICDIQDCKMMVLVINMGHRKNIYQ